jgi:Flp pilus assembly protein TadG
MERKIDIRKWLRWSRRERGSALVEFAVSVPLIIFLLFAVLQGMFAMYAYHYTSWAAQEGARFAMVRGYSWSQHVTTNCQTSPPPNFTLLYNCTAVNTDIQNYVQSLGAMNPGSLTINTSNSYIWPGVTPDNATAPCTSPNQNNSKGCMVRVTTNYTFNLLPLISGSALTMSATSEKVILQ